MKRPCATRKQQIARSHGGKKSNACWSTRSLLLLLARPDLLQPLLLLLLHRRQLLLQVGKVPKENSMSQSTTPNEAVQVSEGGKRLQAVVPHHSQLLLQQKKQSGWHDGRGPHIEGGSDYRATRKHRPWQAHTNTHPPRIPPSTRATQTTTPLLLLHPLKVLAGASKQSQSELWAKSGPTRLFFLHPLKVLAALSLQGGTN